MKINSSTGLINVGTGTYPMYLHQVRKENPNVSFPPNPSEEQLTEFGYAVVHKTTRPEGDVVTEGQPKAVDGKYEQTFEVREYNDEERAQRLLETKAQLRDQINQQREEELTHGHDVLIEDELIGVKLRDTDRLVLTQLLQQAENAVTQGNDAPIDFRARDNSMHALSPAQMVKLATEALAHASAIYSASWVLKDAIEAAAVYSDLPETPVKLVG